VNIRLKALKALIGLDDEGKQKTLLQLIAAHPAMCQRVANEMLIENTPSVDALLAMICHTRPTAFYEAADPTGMLVSQIRPYAEARQKIPAIKRLREITGMGLADSKRWVEEQFPHEFGVRY